MSEADARPSGGAGDGAPHSVRAIVDTLCETADRHARVCAGDVLDAIGHRSYGPALLVPALIEMSPIGGLPGLPTFLALIIAISAAQLLLGREHLWLPGFICRRAIAGAKLHKAVDRMAGLASRLDRWFHGRLPRFVHQPWPRVAAGMVILLCGTVPPLELLPFASTAPMLAIAAFGLALLVKDGLLMLVALGLSVAGLVLGAGLLVPMALGGGEGSAWGVEPG